jgi:hypothetical protein
MGHRDPDRAWSVWIALHHILTPVDLVQVAHRTLVTPTRLGLPDGVGVVHLMQVLTDTRNLRGVWQVVDGNVYQMTPASLLCSRSSRAVKEDFRRIELN